MKNVNMHIDDSSIIISDYYKKLSNDVRQQLINDMLKDIKTSKGNSRKVRNSMQDILPILKDNKCK